MTFFLPLVLPVKTHVKVQVIRETGPCNEYPLKPHFYIVRLGFTGVYLFLLLLIQNIDFGYSLEPPLAMV